MSQAASSNDDVAIDELLNLLNSALKRADKLDAHIVAIHINEAIEALKITKLHP